MPKDRIARERLRGLVVLMEERNLRNMERFEAQEKANALALAGADKATQIALDAARDAVATAAVANEKRFEIQNEWRGQMGDQSRLYMPRAETEALLHTVNGVLSELKKAADTNSGRGAGMGALWGWIIGALGVGLVVAKFFLPS